MLFKDRLQRGDACASLGQPVISVQFRKVLMVLSRPQTAASSLRTFERPARIAEEAWSAVMSIKSVYKHSILVSLFASLYSFVLWLGYWSALFLVPCAIGAAIAAYVCQKMAKRRLQWELASREAEQQLQKQKDGPGILLESFTLGWFNLVIQALWGPILEKHLAGLTGDLLQKVLNEVREKHSAKSPWKFLEAIVLEELRFGAVPPTFQHALAKYDPAAGMLTVTMDVKFTSNSAQAVMLVRTKVLPVVSTAFNIRVEATYVQFSGRLHLGFLLGKEAPGIKGIYYSFATKPNLEIAVRPLGLALPPELLALTGALQGVLQKLISRRMVEPQRRFFDMHRMYMNRHIARFGGPGGLLRVVVHNAKNLSAISNSLRSDSTGSSSSSTADLAAAAARAYASTKQPAAAKAETGRSGRKTPNMATFVQVKFNSQLLRTPVAHHAAAADAVWDWQLSLPLPSDLAAAAAPAGAAAAGKPLAAASAPPAATATASLSTAPAAAVAAAAANKAGSAGGVAPASRAGSSGSVTAAAAAAGDVCTLYVYGAQSLGDPVLLGKCRILLSSLQLKPNGDAQTVTVPIQPVIASKAPAAAANAMITVSLTWLKSTRPLQQRQKWQPQSERVLQPQQQQQGHSPNVSSQSVGSLGRVSPAAGSADSSSSGAAAAAAAAHKSVSWPDQLNVLQKHRVPPPKLEISDTTDANPQQQQQQSEARRVSQSADNSPKTDNKQQQQQRSNSFHKRSATVDLGAAAAIAAAAAAGSSSLAATPRNAATPRDNTVAGFPATPGSTSNASTPKPNAAANARSVAAAAAAAGSAPQTPRSNLAPKPPAAAAAPWASDPARRVTRSEGGASLPPPPAAAAAAATSPAAAAAVGGDLGYNSTLDLTPQQQRDEDREADFLEALDESGEPQQQQQQQQQQVPPRSERRNWLSGSSLSGWGSWIGLSTAAAAASPSSSGNLGTVPAARSGSTGSAAAAAAPQSDDTAAAAAAAEEGAALIAAEADDKAAAAGPPAAAAAAADFTSPLAMLASVVQLQKQVELQQQRMMALQQQLSAVSNRHMKLQQKVGQDARAALLRGARFILHNTDGSSQPVLLYLTQQNPSLVAAAAAAAARPSKSRKKLFGSSASDKADRDSSFGSSSTQQQQQQEEGSPGSVGRLSGRSTPEQQQQQRQQQQQFACSSDGWYLVIAALPADGEGFRAAAKRRIAAVLSHSGNAAAVSSDAGGAAASSSGGGAPAAAAASFNRKQGQLLAHAGGYESGDIARQDLPILRVMPVECLKAAEIKHDSAPQNAFHPYFAINSDVQSEEPSSLVLVVQQGSAATAVGSGTVLALDAEDQSHHSSCSSEQKGTMQVELQLPAVGNGRSVSEWLFALQQLIGKAPDAVAVDLEQL